MTSQLTDPIKWPNYPLDLIGTYVHINAHNKESLTQRSRGWTNVQLCLIFLYISIWFESQWMICVNLHPNYRHGVTITTHAIKRHFLIWMTTVRQPTKRQCSRVLTLKWPLFVFIGERDKESTTPWLWWIDTCDSWGIKQFQTRRSLVWNRFIPHSSQVSIYHIKV